MNVRVAFLVFTVFALTACSSLNRLTRYESENIPPPADTVPAPPPEAAAAPDDAWCQRIAASDRLRAQQAGYDAVTLDRMTLAAYQQCRALGAQ